QDCSSPVAAKVTTLLTKNAPRLLKQEKKSPSAPKAKLKMTPNPTKMPPEKSRQNRSASFLPTFMNLKTGRHLEKPMAFIQLKFAQLCKMVLNELSSSTVAVEPPVTCLNTRMTLENRGAVNPSTPVTLRT